MAPAKQSVKSVVERTAPGKLQKVGARCAFRAVSETGRVRGRRLSGITRRLDARVFSDAKLPSFPMSGFRGRAWVGPGGGIRRGAAVDAQVSRLARLSARHRARARMLKLTRLTFDALTYHELTPISSQRVVLDEARGIATAVDVVCVKGAELVLVELKTGYSGSRTAQACSATPAWLRAPFATAKDCALHRHLAQLAATVALFDAERATAAALGAVGVEAVTAALLYVDDQGSELHALPDWWRRRGARLLGVLS